MLYFAPTGKPIGSRERASAKSKTYQKINTVATKATLFLASWRLVGKHASCKSKKFSRVVAAKRK
jgi:hypothetical protein